MFNGIQGGARRKRRRMKGINNEQSHLSPAKPIFVGGYAAGGKSTLAQKLAKEKDYSLVSMDEVIRHDIVPLYKDEEHSTGQFFTELYAETEPTDPVYKKAKALFVQKLQTEIKKHHGRVVVEGQLKNRDTLRTIMGPNFLFYIARPPSLDDWVQRLKKRWDAEPEECGRLGFLAKADIAMNYEGSKDYKQNGMDGIAFNEMITEAAKERYPKHQIFYDYYKGYFEIEE